MLFSRGGGQSWASLGPAYASRRPLAEMAPNSEDQEMKTPLLYGSYGTCRGSEEKSPGRGKGVLRESWGFIPRYVVYM